MFAASPQLRQRIAQGMQRVLIIDPQVTHVRLLAELLRAVASVEIVAVGDVGRGVKAVKALNPQLIFVEHPAHGVDGYAFTRALRRGDTPSRKAPVIMSTAEATAASILAARDCGVHEFLRKPFTINDLERRLETLITRPRNWVEGLDYVGPDRRRFNSADYTGPRKRRNDAREGEAKGRLLQALQIVRAAAEGFEKDPKQARRAIAAQVAMLKSLVSIFPAMAVPVVALEVWESDHPENTPLARDELRRRALALAPFMPDEQGRAA